MIAAWRFLPKKQKAVKREEVATAMSALPGMGGGNRPMPDSVREIIRWAEATGKKK